MQIWVITIQLGWIDLLVGSVPQNCSTHNTKSSPCIGADGRVSIFDKLQIDIFAARVVSMLWQISPRVCLRDAYACFGNQHNLELRRETEFNYFLSSDKTVTGGLHLPKIKMIYTLRISAEIQTTKTLAHFTPVTHYIEQQKKSLENHDDEWERFSSFCINFCSIKSAVKTIKNDSFHVGCEGVD